MVERANAWKGIKNAPAVTRNSLVQVGGTDATFPAQKRELPD